MLDLFTRFGCLLTRIWNRGIALLRQGLPDLIAEQFITYLFLLLFSDRVKAHLPFLWISGHLLKHIHDRLDLFIVEIKGARWKASQLRSA